MAGDDLCWLDGGREDGGLQVLHSSGRGLPFAFLATAGFFSRVVENLQGMD